MKKKILYYAAALIFIAPYANAAHLKDNLLIAAKLDGAQEVPAVTTNAQGVASLMLNATRDTLCVKVSVTGLSGPITAVHIHEGDMGIVGGVFKDLLPFVSGNQISTLLTGKDISALNISKFLSGKFYINVHTAAHPNGEIRGQLNLETDWSFPVMLSGTNEVPAIVTAAYGVGVFNLSKDLSQIKFNVVTQGLSGAITASHLHFGAVGKNGGVNIDLATYIHGNVITGIINAPSKQLIDSLMMSKVYMNVHTAANANGEIRSQLMTSAKYLYFDAALDSAQVFPKHTLTAAKGAATIKLNTTYDTLWYDIATTGLTGAITAAHFHNGDLAVNGGVEIDLMSHVTGNRIMGTITGSALTTTLINKFLMGTIYVNVHTAAHPDGEIRGQVYRLAREGYTLGLDGSQEVPPVMTAAKGFGVVSISRDENNAHYMFVANGLSGAATGAHFHKEVKGKSGGVLYNLTSMYKNNGAFGFWSSTDTTLAFTPAHSLLFRMDSVYVNVHTAAHPDGEIRGQVMGGFKCSDFATGISKNESAISNFELYPNPATDAINLNFKAVSSTTSSLVIYNVVGKVVYNQVIKLNTGNNTQVIDLKALPNGMYFARIMDADKQVIQKFIKQ
ncbi:MAG: CHRD domain-containing protein [Bacteroidia bacterium]